MPAHPKLPIHAVRGAYETGTESIRAIARRYGVSDRAIRKQAKARGWTRSDHAAALRQLTERDREAIRAAMLMTSADLTRLALGSPFWRR